MSFQDYAGATVRGMAIGHGGHHVLEYNTACDTLSLYEGSAVRGFIGVHTQEPVETVTLSNPEAIIQMALRYGIDLALIGQFIDQEVRAEWKKTGRYDEISNEIRAMTLDEQKKRLATAKTQLTTWW